jgi:uncharacterized protein (TIGR02265 family)
MLFAMSSRALELVGKYCDLEKRLLDIPPSAALRGVWLKSFEAALEKRGVLGRYVEIFGDRASALKWYPCSDVVSRIAVAGALYTSPPEMQAGIREVAHAQALLFSESLLGRALIRLLNPDPVKVLQQGAAARRQTCNYGRWEHDFSHPGEATVRFYEEYVWLESQVLGSAEGTFASIKRKVNIELTLTNAYDGVMKITW